MSELYKQVELVSNKQKVVCWLPCEDVKLRPGLKLTLEGDDTTLWTITKVYNGVRVPKDQLYKPWRVGGLT